MDINEGLLSIGLVRVCAYVQRFCTAAILDGRTMKIICIRKNICSHGKKNLLFLPSNMAAVRNLYMGHVWVLLRSVALPKRHEFHIYFTSKRFRWK